jgi:hypothetical protein
MNKEILNYLMAEKVKYILIIKTKKTCLIFIKQIFIKVVTMILKIRKIILPPYFNLT